MSLLSLLRKDTGRHVLQYGPSKGKTVRIKRLTVTQADTIRLAFAPIAKDMAKDGAESEIIFKERAIELAICLAVAIGKTYEWTLVNVIREDYDAVWLKLMEAERDFFGGLTAKARPNLMKTKTRLMNETDGLGTSSS